MGNINEARYLARPGMFVICEMKPPVIAQVIAHGEEKWTVMPVRTVERRLKILTAQSLNVPIQDIRLFEVEDLENGDAMIVWDGDQPKEILIQSGGTYIGEHADPNIIENLRGKSMVMCMSERYPENKESSEKRDQIIELCVKTMTEFSVKLLELYDLDEASEQFKSDIIGAATLHCCAALSDAITVSTTASQDKKQIEGTVHALMVVSMAEAIMRYDAINVIPNFKQNVLMTIQALSDAEKPKEKSKLN